MPAHGILLQASARKTHRRPFSPSHPKQATPQGTAYFQQRSSIPLLILTAVVRTISMPILIHHQLPRVVTLILHFLLTRCPSSTSKTGARPTCRPAVPCSDISTLFQFLHRPLAFSRPCPHNLAPHPSPYLHREEWLPPVTPSTALMHAIASRPSIPGVKPCWLPAPAFLKRVLQSEQPLVRTAGLVWAALPREPPG